MAITKTLCPKCGCSHWSPEGLLGSIKCVCGYNLQHETRQKRVESAPDPVSHVTRVASRAQPSAQLRREGAEAWAVLHTMEKPSFRKVLAWITNHVPKYGCGCADYAREYISVKPPPGNLAEFRVWSWEFHDSVDQKTGDARMTYEEAAEVWSW